MEIDLEKFAARLRELRKQAGLTQEELGERLGFKPTTVSSWELAYRVPELVSVYRLAEFFGVSIDYLLGRTDDPRPVIGTNLENRIHEGLVFFTRLSNLSPKRRKKVLQELEWQESEEEEERRRTSREAEEEIE
ncbi:MAG: helix-turn-helix domain-containing protein [Moorellaceae bacterium]